MNESATGDDVKSNFGENARTDWRRNRRAWILAKGENNVEYGDDARANGNAAYTYGVDPSGSAQDAMDE